MNYSDIVKLNKLAHRGKDEPSSLSEYLLVGLFAVIIFAVLVLPFVAYSIWANAIVIKAFWMWFLVPLFPTLEPVSLSQAWGLALIVTFFTHVPYTCKSKDERESSEKITEFVMLFLKPWMALGVGYICARYFLHVV